MAATRRAVCYDGTGATGRPGRCGRHQEVNSSTVYTAKSGQDFVGATTGSGTTTVQGGASLTADSIIQGTLRINAGGKVAIVGAGTSVVNFLNIANGSGSFSWDAGGSGIAPAGLGETDVNSGATVPEPATWMLAVMAALAGLVAWRRRK